MKRFMLINTVIFFLILGVKSGLIRKISNYDTIEYFTKVEGKEILINKNNKWNEIKITGINMNPGKPGAFPGDSFISNEEYLRWFSYIKDMNVNCIRIQNIMPEEFYEALEQFNNEKEEPLYILQGIYFNEVYLKDGYNPQTKDMKKKFKDYIEAVVNIVHGESYNRVNLNLFESYKTNVSKYVIGYTVGIEWQAHDLIYSEIMNDKSPYEGEYFYTSENASSFESFLAEAGDYVAQYEAKNYGEQRLITFVGSSSLHIKKSTSLSNGSTIILEQDEKDNIKSFIDVENIKTTEELKTGIFVSYNIYPSVSTLLMYEGDSGLFFSDINNYHTIPVVISEYGIPSSRLATDFISDTSKGYINETEQAQALVDTYNAIKKSGCAGSIIAEWGDSWFRSAWNTKDRIILDKSAYWSDTQTYSQSFGLMAFEPGNEESVSYPDNSNNEWKEEDILSSKPEVSLSMKSDEKYLYFMVNMKDGFNPLSEDIYIDLDVTPNSGATKSTQYDLQFDGQADFIIHVSDVESSKVLVHEYYNTHNFLEQEKQLQIRPDIINHTSDMDEFSEIMIYTRPKTYVEALGGFVEKQSTETGRLIHGNGNPTISEFNSISDFYIGEDYVEVRIPWALLNFMDPSTKQIHDDYYDTFDITPISIKGIYAGVTVKENNDTINRIDSKLYKWNQWTKPTYHERLKKSYYLLKEELSKASN
ncbi:hypothetical protein [Oceanirhabdus seepicola]|uniref:Uncharacterized protein n=1 Tax=Oceanirhabdus seepicola TaxID=2828781 RepID=A0A9J6P0Q5_9CLOT|nr:hypothetical protein [Oceanirhabdus seepicola]MCM1990223.1 hypothetical protein [Oceanirhabdus seepicola]